MYLRKFKDRSTGCNGIRLHFIEWGSENDPVILLLHGLQASGHYFDEFSSSMASNYHVIAIDFRGHGDSDKPLEGYDPFDYVSDIECIKNTLALKEFAVVAHSLGAIIGLLYAAQHHNTVKATVAAEIPITWFRLTGKLLTLLLSLMMREQEGFSDRTEAIRFFRKKHPFASSKILESMVHWSLTRTDEGGFLWKAPWTTVEQTIKSLSKLDLWSYFPNVMCPTLLIQGEKGLLSEKIVERIIGRMPKARAAEIKAAGHGVPADNPKDFTFEVKTFLDNVIK